MRGHEGGTHVCGHLGNGAVGAHIWSRATQRPSGARHINRDWKGHSVTDMGKSRGLAYPTAVSSAIREYRLPLRNPWFPQRAVEGGESWKSWWHPGTTGQVLRSPYQDKDKGLSHCAPRGSRIPPLQRPRRMSSGSWHYLETAKVTMSPQAQARHAQASLQASVLTRVPQGSQSLKCGMRMI